MMSLATDNVYCRLHHFNSTYRMQHQPGMGFEHLAMLSNPAPGTTIEYCDSPYHILATNVNTRRQFAREASAPSSRKTIPLSTLLTIDPLVRSYRSVELWLLLVCDLGIDEDDSAGDLAASQLLKYIVGFG
jgi:hypothetical protein